MFRRRKSESPVSEEVELPSDEAVDDGGAQAPGGERTGGPWDMSEVVLDPEDASLIDLGGLIVRGRQDLQLQLNRHQRLSHWHRVMLRVRKCQRKEASLGLQEAMITAIDAAVSLNI